MAQVKPAVKEEVGVATMKAVRIHSFGGPQALTYEDVPRPAPGPDEVLIRVHAAGVNPVDWKIREGYRKESVSLPLILGWDFSGVVEITGSSVRRIRKGDEVFGRPDTARDGAYAEYLVARESEIALKPKSVNHVHAAGLALAGLTAWQGLFDVGGVKPNHKVLIHAAAGGVGGYAVQLAKWKGAYVIGTCSGRNEDYVHSLGADETINYETTKFEDAVQGADMVFDTVGGEVQKRSWPVLKKHGILVSIVSPPSAEEAEKYGVRQAIFRAETNADQLTELARLVDTGKLKIYVDTVLPLAEARKAHEMSKSGHVRGKLVLKVF